jgi:hypothetical protein
MDGLSFVTLLAYDYRYAFDAIRSYYDIADEIILGLDCDRLSLRRQPFAIDMNEVAAFISQIDRNKKIRLIEENFHSDDHPMGNETLERCMLSLQCAQGNWVVQIDSDEILMNGPEFRRWILAASPDHTYQAKWINVFKSFGDKALMIDPPTELTPVATKLRGQYARARVTRQPVALSPLNMLHFSWGRTPDELMQKLRNWSHSLDFNVDTFFKMWQSIDLQNYQSFHNFHPIDGPTWQNLRLATLHFDRWKNPVKNVAP